MKYLIVLTVLILCIWVIRYVKFHTIKFEERGKKMSYFHRVNKKLFIIAIGRYAFHSNLEETLRIYEEAKNAE